MKFKSLILFAGFSIITLSSCKKEVLSPEAFTAKHLQGSWWLKEKIEISERNGIVIKIDTFKYWRDILPDTIERDSLIFFNDSRYSRNHGDTLVYKLNPEANKIDFTGLLGIWNINSLKMNEILLEQNKSNSTSSSTTSTTTLELFVRKNKS